jgi:diacylglycerol kinase family enzyme
VDDAMLDFVSIGDVHRLARVPLFASALRGAHVTHPKVQVARSARGVLEFDAPPSFELDGELHHSRERVVTIETVPGALRVLTRSL